MENIDIPFNQHFLGSEIIPTIDNLRAFFPDYIITITPLGCNGYDLRHKQTKRSVLIGIQKKQSIVFCMLSGHTPKKYEIYNLLEWQVAKQVIINFLQKGIQKTPAVTLRNLGRHKVDTFMDLLPRI